jgi:hypothetical protein
MKGMAIVGPALQEQPRQIGPPPDVSEPASQEQPRQISPPPDVSERTSSASAKSEGQANTEARGE